MHLPLIVYLTEQKLGGKKIKRKNQKHEQQQQQYKHSGFNEVQWFIEHWVINNKDPKWKWWQGIRWNCSFNANDRLILDDFHFDMDRNHTHTHTHTYVRRRRTRRKRERKPARARAIWTKTNDFDVAFEWFVSHLIFFFLCYEGNGFSCFHSLFVTFVIQVWNSTETVTNCYFHSVVFFHSYYHPHSEMNFFFRNEQEKRQNEGREGR